MIHEIECAKDLSFAVEGDYPQKVWTCKVENRDDQKQLTKLIRESGDWTSNEARYLFYEKFAQLIREWQGKPLNPMKIGLSTRQIDELLMEAANWRRTRCNYRGQLVIKFVRFSGYKDRVYKLARCKRVEHPVIRTTPLHVAARYHLSYYCHSLIADLFEIYDRRNVNFADDDTGLTHLHVACLSDRHAGVVQSFLGQVDPNCRTFKTADTPLHFALRWLANWKNVPPLLEAGANPKLANAKGSTPLHVICQKEEFRPNRAKQFLELTKEMKRPVDVDAWDHMGSPLEWAVARLLPNTVDVLMDNGADLSNFTFPAEDFFGEIVYAFTNRNQKPASSALYKNRLRLVSGALAVVERLKKKGYQLEPSDARTIETFFAKHGVSGRVSAKDSKSSYVRGMKRLEGKVYRKPTKSLLKDCEKLKTPTQYYKFSRDLDGLDLHPEFRRALDQHLCERASRGFFLKSAQRRPRVEAWNE